MNVTSLAKAYEPTSAEPEVKSAERVAVIGLGYVGLPLAVRLSSVLGAVVGYDISTERVAELTAGFDSTNEVTPEMLDAADMLFSVDPEDLRSATFFIVTVPTPITDTNQPDLEPLRSACRVIAPYLKKGDVVVFESTVYPGVTEDVCGKLLAELSGLTCGEDFNLGYSPERINPGDKVNTVEKIVKNISADTPETLDRLEAVYAPAIEAGVYRCSSIRVAEAAKVIENTQRDVNIALMNELALICQRIGISAREVIDAASTKWNFIPFTPGLVGGHCIGIDPYYLASLGERVGYHPEVILAGRRLNDSMVRHVVSALIKRLMSKGCDVKSARVGLFGIAFKEDVPDIRNSKAIEMIAELQSYGLDPMVHDAHCPAEVALREGITLTPIDQMGKLDLMIVAAPHKAYRDDPDFLTHLAPGGTFADIRGAFAGREEVKNIDHWIL